MNRLVDIFNHQNFIIMKIGIRSFVQFTGKNKVYQSVALFLQKCVKTNLLASVTPKMFSGSLTLAMKQRLCPPQYFCQVYAYKWCRCILPGFLLQDRHCVPRSSTLLIKRKKTTTTLDIPVKRPDRSSLSPAKETEKEKMSLYCPLS
jgi:hypothetical protein